GTDLSGWRGCPAPPVSPRSSRCAEAQTVRLERLPSSAGISPLKSLSLRYSLSGWRGCPAPAVSPRSSRCREVQLCQVGEAAQLRGISPLKSLPRGQLCQVGEAA
ncbi:hypothetical protein GBAR_LOCUS17701, partial [Geodia barretti]